MIDLLTAAQMRAAERAAIDSGAVTGLELMERAGAGVVAAVLAEWPELAATSHHAVVLCGPGNNGGDGFVVARLLKARGWEVEVFLYGDPSWLPPDARTNHDVWTGMGAVSALAADAVREGPRPSVLVDAMFGTGLSRAIPLDCAEAFHAVGKRDAAGRPRALVPYRRVAVDCPSGLDCDSGQFLLPPPPPDTGEAVEAHIGRYSTDASLWHLFADLTVTFHCRKLGHYLCGNVPRLRVVDIGLGPEGRHPAHLAGGRSQDVACLLDFDAPTDRSRRFWPGTLLDKARGGGHKYDHGQALILSGGAGRTGAARLAARGALRIGAGLVTLGVPPAAQMEVAGQIMALMLRRMDGAGQLEEVLGDARMTAVCLGPGLGLERARDLVPVALRLEREVPAQGRDSGLGVVLDADALTAYAEAPETLFAMLHAGCVLTPHGGEFARLFPDIAAKLAEPATSGPAYSKVDATRDAAARAGSVVLFKGPDTVIADQTGRASINAAVYDRAAPWLATAGSGDVLAGFIAGLLARGLAPMQAAETAAWLHTECALSFGPGLIAEDLPEELPKVLGALGL